MMHIVHILFFLLFNDNKKYSILTVPTCRYCKSIPFYSSNNADSKVEYKSDKNLYIFGVIRLNIVNLTYNIKTLLFHIFQILSTG